MLNLVCSLDRLEFPMEICQGSEVWWSACFCFPVMRVTASSNEPHSKHILCIILRNDNKFPDLQCTHGVTVNTQEVLHHWLGLNSAAHLPGLNPNSPHSLYAPKIIRKKGRKERLIFLPRVCELGIVHNFQESLI